MTKPDPALLLLSRYPFQVELQTRFGDVDSLRHINNVAIAQLFEESRLRFLIEARGDALDPLSQSIRLVTAEIRFIYLREVAYPDSVVAGVSVEHIGNSSYRLGCAMFQFDQCVALCETAMVRSEVGGSVPLPIELKTAFERYRPV
ncbi:MAG: hypothetical protein JWM78_1168 [Verrucomicrobiaceae bacterium]|nr:hypothetical protein [Verrucomicrobiaceae bacterium]